LSKNGTQGFARTGMLLVTNSANAEQLIRYTGLAADAFEGCAALLPGAGSAAAGTVVTQATLEASIDALLNSIALPQFPVPRPLPWFLDDRVWPGGIITAETW